MPYGGARVPSTTWTLCRPHGLCVCPSMPDSFISKQSQTALQLFTHVCVIHPYLRRCCSLGYKVKDQPKVKDKITLTCNPGAGPRLGHAMVYHINEGIQYCISLCMCLLSVLQVFNEGGSVRKEKRRARDSPGAQGSWKKRPVIICSPQ